ncbi:MAG: hypothetical protein WAO58_07990 [Fimbriimonadaceae bacterium]
MAIYGQTDTTSIQFQAVSAYGTSTPWVARIAMQNMDILKFCGVPEQTKLEANAALMGLVERMAPLEKAKEEIVGQVKAAFAAFESEGADFNWAFPGKPIPSVPDLKSQAEGFIQSAKVALIAAAQVLNPFFGTSFDYRFNHIVAWARTTFGESDGFTENIEQCESFVSEFLKMRTAIEHPGSATFFVRNVQIVKQEGRWAFDLPVWGLQGKTQSPMLTDMQTIIENITEISDILCTEIFLKKPNAFPMHLEVIPEEKRDPQCPVRLRVVPSIMPDIRA